MKISNSVLLYIYYILWMHKSKLYDIFDFNVLKACYFLYR